MNPIRYIFIIPVVVLMSLLPVSAYGTAGAGKPPPADQMKPNTPPVEQPLVPEGYFAVQLVQVLKMGPAQDEAQAENALSSVGIEPKNGWIAGYPVTPPVIGEIEEGVAAAAETGKLKMGKAEALKALADLKARGGLNITPGAISQPAVPQTIPGGEVENSVIYRYVDKEGVIHFTDQYESIPLEYRNQVETIRGNPRPSYSVAPPSEDIQAQAPEDISLPNPGPEVVDNYYYEPGPPVVTYYEPPQPYYYLYAWVPYPFWCSGFFFSGYYILHDFHRHVFFHKKSFVVTNHVVTHNQGFFVEPVNRNLRRSGTPVRPTSPRIVHTTRVQPGSRPVAGFSRKRTAPATAPTPSRAPQGGPRTISQGPLPTITKAPPPTGVTRPQGSIRPGQPASAGQRGLTRNNPVPPRATGGRTFGPPAVRGIFSSTPPPRVSRPPTVTHGRIFSSPSSGGRGFSGGSQGGRSFGKGSFFRGGFRGNR